MNTKQLNHLPRFVSHLQSQSQNISIYSFPTTLRRFPSPQRRNRGNDTLYHTLNLNSYTVINLKYRLAFKFIMKKYIIGNIFQLLLYLKPRKNNLIMHVTTDFFFHNYTFIPNNALATNIFFFFFPSTSTVRSTYFESTLPWVI